MSTVDIIQAFKEMPFYGCPDFDIIVEFTSARDRITSLMNDIGAARFVRPAPGIMPLVNIMMRNNLPAPLNANVNQLRTSISSVLI